MDGVLFPPDTQSFRIAVYFGLVRGFRVADCHSGIASVEDVCRQLPFQEAMLYLFALLGVCAGCYLFFSLTTLYYLGYPFFLFYVGWALRRYFRYAVVLTFADVAGPSFTARGVARVAVHGMNDRYALSGGG